MWCVERQGTSLGRRTAVRLEATSKLGFKGKEQCARSKEKETFRCRECHGPRQEKSRCQVMNEMSRVTGVGMRLWEGVSRHCRIRVSPQRAGDAKFGF